MQNGSRTARRARGALRRNRCASHLLVPRALRAVGDGTVLASPPNMRTTFTIVLGATLLTACASTPGARPHDMSAEQHEAMANEQAALAQVHADKALERCAPRGACWNYGANATPQELDEASRHRRMAADHRAAANALRDAEASACGGLSDDDRDISPFEHHRDILSVEPLGVIATVGKQQVARTTGAVITFRALPGMTTEWLQRVIDCHLARNAALGHDVPEMADCPLVPRDVSARVTATSAGFAVAVSSENPDSAAEVLRRARALVEP